MNTIRILPMFIILFGLKAEAIAVKNYSPVVRIQSPANGSKFKIDEKITFKGMATDLEDGELLGKSLVWTSGLDRYLGQGNSFSCVLSAGFHIITLAATDLEHAEGRDSVFVIVGTSERTELMEKTEVEKPEVKKTETEEAKAEKQRKPSIEFIYVPSINSSKDLRGKVLNANPDSFAVAVYIIVSGGWWSKPYWATPLTEIRDDGSWICDITTNGIDEKAVKIVAYLVPASYIVPLAAGDFRLPQEIENVAVAKVKALRHLSGKIIITPVIKSEDIKPEIKKPEVTKEIPKKAKRLMKKPTVREEEKMRRYFPLAVGNIWGYKRTVFPGKTPLNRFECEVIEDLDMTGDGRHTILGFGIEPSITSRNEIYKVISQESENFIIEGYTTNKKGEREMVEGYEPYTLQELEKLIWRVNEWSGKTFVVYEIKEGIDLGNRVHCAELIGFLKPDGGLLINVEPNSESKKYHKKVMSEYGGKIKVPAGTFNKTLKNTFEFIGGVEVEDVKIIRFFVKDVGLIKEIQYDSKGEITYQLELVEYNVR